MSEGDILEPDDFLLSSVSGKGGELELETYNLEEIEKAVILESTETISGKRKSGCCRTWSYAAHRFTDAWKNMVYKKFRTNVLIRIIDSAPQFSCFSIPSKHGSILLLC